MSENSPRAIAVRTPIFTFRTGFGLSLDPPGVLILHHPLPFPSLGSGGLATLRSGACLFSQHRSHSVLVQVSHEHEDTAVWALDAPDVCRLVCGLVRRPVVATLTLLPFSRISRSLGRGSRFIPPLFTLALFSLPSRVLPMVDGGLFWRWAVHLGLHTDELGQVAVVLVIFPAHADRVLLDYIYHVGMELTIPFLDAVKARERNDDLLI